MDKIPVPSALIVDPREETDYVAGAFSQIEYKVNVPDGDWAPWLPTHEPQKYKFDTDECSQLSGVNISETICNWLKATNQLSDDAIAWFQTNGYFDDNDSFAFSERFSGILTGTSINGGSQWNFWQNASKNGFLPRKDLCYTMAQSQQFTSQAAMCEDYYNPSAVTPEMRQKALGALQWLNIQYEWVGSNPAVAVAPEEMVQGLKQAPLHIGVPVCMNTWNLTDGQSIIALCDRRVVDHAIELVEFTANNTYRIRDHYNPYDKILAPGYFIPLVTKGVITPTPDGNRIVIDNMKQQVSLLQRIINILKQILAR